jgi:hypothetical protein
MIAGSGDSASGEPLTAFSNRRLGLEARRTVHWSGQQDDLLTIGTSGGGGFLPFPSLEHDRSRTVSGRLRHSFELPARIHQINAQTR